MKIVNKNKVDGGEVRYSIFPKVLISEIQGWVSMRGDANWQCLMIGACEKAS